MGRWRDFSAGRERARAGRNMGDAVSHYFIAPGFGGKGANSRSRSCAAVSMHRLARDSAWCLGVLNSHHKFFMSYAAGVAFNIAMIATLLIYGPRRSQDTLAIYLAWGAVAGAALQIVVQLPQTWGCCESCG